MKNRIQKKFEELKQRKHKALIVFMTAGDPSLKKNEELLYALEKEGVDLVELGVPFSDPLADGPVIQASSQRALRRGTSLQKILTLVRKARKKSEIPILLMSYFNPILRFGVARFVKAARSAGVDGMIIPDLPPDEGSRISSVLRHASIHLVYLLAPTSNPERQRRVARSSRGFVYYVSLTGVTGAGGLRIADVEKSIAQIKNITSLPVCVGFGVSTPQQARRLSRVADGVIVGSAVVQALANYSREPLSTFCRRHIRPFVSAVHPGGGRS